MPKVRRWSGILGRSFLEKLIGSVHRAEKYFEAACASIRPKSLVPAIVTAL